MSVALDRETTGPVTLDRQGILEGRIMPWDQDAEVTDVVDDRIEHFVEAFRRGAFDPQTTSQNRGTIRKVEFHEAHTDGPGKVGYALDFEDREDGQWGQFRVMPRFVDDVAQMVEDGVDGLSVRFVPKPGGTITSWTGRLERRLRTAAHLVHVALVPEPAYAFSRVAQLRDAEAERLAEHQAAARTAEADRILAEMAASASRWTADA